MKRKYVKKDCSYWGHDYKFYGEIKGKWIFRCERQNCGHLKESRGLDDMALGHLLDITLENLPAPDLKDFVGYEFCDIYKNKG